jgi:hypothetical protein
MPMQLQARVVSSVGLRARKGGNILGFGCRYAHGGLQQPVSAHHNTPLAQLAATLLPAVALYTTI